MAMRRGFALRRGFVMCDALPCIATGWKLCMPTGLSAALQAGGLRYVRWDK